MLYTTATHPHGARPTDSPAEDTPDPRDRLLNTTLDNKDALRVDLSDIIRTLWSRKFFIVTIIALVALPTAFVVNTLPPLYDAEATILIDNKYARLPDAPSIYPEFTPSDESVDTEMQIMQSREILRRAVTRLDLVDDLEFNPPRWPTLLFHLPHFFQSMMPSKSTPGTLPPDQEIAYVTDNLLKRVETDTIGKSYVVALRVTSKNPATAATIANTIATLYIEDQERLKSKGADRLSAWMSGRISDLQASVLKAERRIEVFREENGLFEANGATLLDTRVAALNSDLGQARIKRIETANRLRQVEDALRSGTVDATAEVLSSSLIQSLRTQQSVLDREIAELSTEYGNLHPRMVQLTSEKTDLQTKIDREIQKIVQELKNQHRIARSNEYALTATLNKLQTELTNSNKAEVELREMERNAESVRNMLQETLVKADEVGYSGELQRPDAQILSLATVPYKPSAPKKTTIIILALIVALMLSMLLVLVREQFVRNYRNRSDFEKDLGIVPLAVIPMSRQSRRASESFSRLHPAVNESFRTLLFEATRQRNGDPAPRVILVTSADLGEGKTTVCMGLSSAASSTDGGASVALVDFDLPNPSLHMYFSDAENVPGIKDFLRGKVRHDELETIDQKSGIALISAGSTSDDCAIMSLHRRQRIDELLEYLRSTYDLVVIDGGCISNHSGARYLASKADATIMVVRAKVSDRRSVNSALLEALRISNGGIGVALSGIR